MKKLRLFCLGLILTFTSPFAHAGLDGTVLDGLIPLSSTTALVAVGFTVIAPAEATIVAAATTIVWTLDSMTNNLKERELELLQGDAIRYLADGEKSRYLKNIVEEVRKTDEGFHLTDTEIASIILMIRHTGN